MMRETNKPDGFEIQFYRQVHTATHATPTPAPAPKRERESVCVCEKKEEGEKERREDEAAAELHFASEKAVFLPNALF